MQASNGKDITLHVSANNPAMVSTKLTFEGGRKGVWYEHMWENRKKVNMTDVSLFDPRLLDHVPKVWIQAWTVPGELLQGVPARGQHHVPQRIFRALEAIVHK